MIPQNKFKELLEQFTNNQIDQNELKKYFKSLTENKEATDFDYDELKIIKMQLLTLVLRSIQLNKDVREAIKALLGSFKISYYHVKNMAAQKNNQQLVNCFQEYEQNLSFTDLIITMTDINNSKEEVDYFLNLLEERIKSSKQKKAKFLEACKKGINDNILIGLLEIIICRDNSELLELILTAVPKERIEKLSFEFIFDKKIEFEVPKEKSPIKYDKEYDLDFKAFVVAKNAKNCVQVLLQNKYNFEPFTTDSFPPFTLALLFKHQEIIDLIANAPYKLKCPKRFEDYLAYNYVYTASLIYPVSTLVQLFNAQPNLKKLITSELFQYAVSTTSISNVCFLMSQFEFETAKDIYNLLHATNLIMRTGNFDAKVNLKNFIVSYFKKPVPHLDKNADVLTSVMMFCIYLLNISLDPKIKEAHEKYKENPYKVYQAEDFEFVKTIKDLDETKVNNNNDTVTLGYRFTDVVTEIELFKEIFSRLYYASKASFLNQEFPFDNVRASIFTMTMLAGMYEIAGDMIKNRNVPIENLHVMLFCRHGQGELLQYILSKQDGLNLYDYSAEGYTALDYAVLNNSKVCVEAILHYILHDEQHAAFGEVAKYIQRALKLTTENSDEIKQLLLARLPENTKKKSSYDLVLKQLTPEENDENKTSTTSATPAVINFEFKDRAKRDCIAHIDEKQYMSLQGQKGNVFDKVFAFIKDYGIFGYRMKEIKLEDKIAYKIRPTGVFGDTRVYLFEDHVDQKGVIHYTACVKDHETMKAMQSKVTF